MSINRRAWSLSILLLLGALSAARLAAQEPRLLSYQGVLADSRRTAVADGKYSVTFRIYDAGIGGVPLWEEIDAVETIDGIFETILGDATPLMLDFDRSYWIALQIPGEPEMTPRIRFTSAPYAMRSIVADSALRIDANAPGVVHTLNALDGNLVLIGEGEVSIRTSGDTLAVVVPNRLPENAADGQVIRWNGTLDAWEAIDPSISTTARLTGNGSPGAPLDIAPMGATDRQPLIWDATLRAWRPGEAGVRVTAPLSGDGSSAAPIGLQGGSADGQVLRWENGAWKPAEQSVAAGAEISGTGTKADPLRLAQQGASNGEVLRWDASARRWEPGPSVYIVTPPLRGTGAPDDPVGFDDGSVAGQLFYWDGSKWKITAARGPREGDFLRWNAGSGVWEPAALEVTGTAPLDRGSIWYGDGGDRAAERPIGAAGQVLVVDGDAGVPVWSSNLNVDSVNANVATVSGDATIGGELHVSGTTTLSDGATIGGSLLVNDSAIFNGPVEFTQFPEMGLPENALIVGDGSNHATPLASTNEDGAVLRLDGNGAPGWSRDLDVASVEAEVLDVSGDVKIAGDLVVAGTTVTVPTGSIDNDELASATIDLVYGPGLTGDASVALGGTLVLENSGVTSLDGTANQVSVDRSTGAVTLSLPQDIHTDARPTFDGLVLDNLIAGSDANEIVVSNNGTIETRSFASLNPGGVLPAGTGANTTLRWNGSAWVENIGVTADSQGNVSASGSLTVSGATVNLPPKSIDSEELVHSTIGVTYGPGLAGDASVALGGALNVRNTGIISATAGAGIAVDTDAGSLTISNTGVTSLYGSEHQVAVDRSTGEITLSLPQDIHSDATPRFNTIVLDSLATGSASTEMMVSNGGMVETRSFSSLHPGGVLPAGTAPDATLRWDGTAWVENPAVTADATGNVAASGSVTVGGDIAAIGDAAISGDLTVSGTKATLPAGSVDNTELAHSTIDVAYGPGLAGDTPVTLGGTLNLRSTGVTSTSAGAGVWIDTIRGDVTITNAGVRSTKGGAGITVDTTRGDVTITNAGVTSISGMPNQVIVDRSTGEVTLALPQAIHTDATPTFDGITLDNLKGNSASGEIVVSNNGAVETRSAASLHPGGILPVGATPDATLRWNGTAWVENPAVTADGSGNLTTGGSATVSGSIASGGDATVAGNLTVNGTAANLPAKSIDNSELANPTIGVMYGPGIAGDGSVALGGTLNVRSTGVTSTTGGEGIAIDTARGDVTITNTGVTSLAGSPNQVMVDQTTGGVTLSLPQDIHADASPTFNGLVLDGLAKNSTSSEIVVTNGGAIETRSFSSLIPGGVLPEGTSGNTTLRWDGTAWVENTQVTMDGAGGVTTTGSAAIGGDLTVNGTAANLPAKSIDNTELLHSTIGVTYGAGLDGDGSVALGGTLNVRNTGVTSAVSGAGIAVDTAHGSITITNIGVRSAKAGEGITVDTVRGDITITNSGVTSITGAANQVSVSGSTGAVTLSLPQEIHTDATPRFNGLMLDSLMGNSPSNQIMVSNNGVVETRSFSSLISGSTLADGSIDNTTLRWNGTAWVENAGVKGDSAGNISVSGGAAVGGNLTVAGTEANLPAGSIDNVELAHSTIDLTYGPGIAGDLSIALGDTLNIRSTGVVTATAGPGIGIDTARGDITITNTGVTSLSGTTNQVSVDQSTGAVTLSLPQDIHADAVPTFNSIILDGLNNSSVSSQLMVSNNGAVETRSLASIHPGGVLPAGTSGNATLRWNGAAWVENTSVKSDSLGNLTTSGNTAIGGDLTVSGTAVALPAGSIDNTELAHSTIGITYGSGIGGDPGVTLGGTLNLRSTGVTSTTAGTGIGVDTTRGDITITNTGVTALGGTTNQVSVSQATGAITLSLPQDIHADATPRFDGIILDNLTGGSAASEIVVSNGGLLETRAYSSLIPGGILPAGTSANSTMRWNGSAWVENPSVTGDSAGNLTTSGGAVIGGNLTVSGTTVDLPAGSIDNAELASPAIDVTYGTGISGSASVSLGGTLNVQNTGVTSLAGTANQVSVSQATGAITLSLPQNIHSGATPTFSGITLNSLPAGSTSDTLLVSNGGTVRTRTVASITASLGSQFWMSSGNSGTTPGTHFLGTQDNQPFEIRVDNNNASSVNGRGRVMRYEPNNTSPNIIGGFSGNSAGSGVTGVTIAGGGRAAGPNSVGSSFGTVSGGRLNVIDTAADYTTIGGGVSNRIGAGSMGSGIWGGGGNSVRLNVAYGTIGGGESNLIDTGATWSTISGGNGNQILKSAVRSTIGGGGINSIRGSATNGTIGGGSGNSISPGASAATIGGGTSNTIDTSVSNGTIAGGSGNLIGKSVSNSTIGGGNNNAIRGGITGTIGGGMGNLVNASGGTIGGGNSNAINPSATYGTISGGLGNILDSNAFAAVIGGGSTNIIRPSAYYSTIAGGLQNIIDTSATNSVIGGGMGNTVRPGISYSAIAGGQSNSAGATHGAIGGGNLNAIRLGATHAAIVGGQNNTIDSSATHSAIGGGQLNLIDNNSVNGVIAGGRDNTIRGGATHGAIGGGMSNVVAGNYSTVAGGRGLTLSGSGSLGFLGANAAGSKDMTISASDVVVFGNTDLWLANNDNAPSQLRFYSGYNSFGAFPAATKHTSFEAPISLSADIRYILPDTAGIVGDMLAVKAVSGTQVTLDWASSGTGTGWSLTGNSGTTPGTHFIGTADNQPVEIRANNASATASNGRGRVMRYEPNNTSPNIIGGFKGNSIGASAVGSTIAGGGQSGLPQTISANQGFIGGGGGNTISAGADYGTIAGGAFNILSVTATHGTIGGGSQNRIDTGSTYSTIAGGSHNQIDNSITYGTIGGGFTNTVNATSSTIAGGVNNRINSSLGTIGGGATNLIGSGSSYSTIGGGRNHRIDASYGSISGGAADTIRTGASYSTIGGGDGNIVDLNAAFGVIGGGLNNLIGRDAGGATIGGGRSNLVRGDSGTVGGGSNNSIQAGSIRSTIAGGGDNYLDSNSIFGAIGGGSNNLIDRNVGAATIGGGRQNTVRGDSSTIGGGHNNNIASGATAGTISGGGNNSIGSSAIRGTIGGGFDNTVSASSATIGGGFDNTVSASSATIAGGDSNSVGSAADRSTIGGGGRNRVGGGADLSTIGGGVDNTIGNDVTGGTIAGGTSNTIGHHASTGAIGGGVLNAIGNHASFSIISGGGLNDIGDSSQYAAVGGGLNNIIGSNADYATIVGGNGNQVSGLYSAIGGGRNNDVSGLYSVIGGGRDNEVSGEYSAIPSGRGLTLSGDRSFGFLGGNSGPNDMSISANDVAVFGNTDLWLANNDGTASQLRFYEANSTTGAFPGTRQFSSFHAQAQTADIQYQLPATVGAVGTQLTISAVAGTVVTLNWGAASDRSVKSDIVTLDGESILRKFRGLELGSWRYTNDPSGLRHYGIMAQDFKRLFGHDGLGEIGTDTTVNDIDLAGVSFLAIQGLEKRTHVASEAIESLNVENRELRVENAELRRRIEILEEKIESADALQERLDRLEKMLEEPVREKVR